MDVISTANQTTSSLTSPYMTAIPCRFAAHPYEVGTLAGATGGVPSKHFSNVNFVEAEETWFFSVNVAIFVLLYNLE
ncbi:hypothetical protein ACLOJK_027434 [Asimina triloba]